MSRPSLRDVAKQAGTSTAVVSYVVNGGPRPVAEATRQRVQAAIAKLGYRPNTVARSLRTRRTGTIGLVVPDLSKAFFAELAAAIEAAALGRGQRLLVGSTRFAPLRELEQLNALIDARVDGIVLVPTQDLGPPLQLLANAGIQTVIVHRHTVKTDIEWPPDWRPMLVVADDYDAGRQAAEHLLEHGHERLGCLTGPGPGTPVAQRAAGFQETVGRALGEEGYDHDLLVSCGYERLAEEAYRGTLDLLRRRPDVTALCATTDEHAFGVIRAATESGRHIGKDLALISIDGTHTTDYLTPPLTVLRSPLLRLGAQSVSDLLTRLAGNEVNEQEPLPLQLILRRSCGCHADS